MVCLCLFACLVYATLQKKETSSNQHFPFTNTASFRRFGNICKKEQNGNQYDFKYTKILDKIVFPVFLIIKICATDTTLNMKNKHDYN